MSKCKLFNEHKAQIKEYCDNNALDYGIVEASYKSWGEGHINILYYEDNKSNEGLRDKEPLPIVLKIYIENDGVRIAQTEHTQRRISIKSSRPQARRWA